MAERGLGADGSTESGATKSEGWKRVKTRCEENEECVVVGGFPLSNLNTRVVVTELVLWLGRPHWLYEGSVLAMNGDRAHCIADDCLLPVRKRDQVVDDPRRGSPQRQTEETGQ